MRALYAKFGTRGTGNGRGDTELGTRGTGNEIQDSSDAACPLPAGFNHRAAETAIAPEPSNSYPALRVAFPVSLVPYRH